MNDDGPDRGWAGASAHREGASRFGPDRRAWEQGAVGEAIVGRVLDGVPGALVLHDRAMPGRSANIDHIAVAASGVYVIDAKHYSGEPRVDTIHGSGDSPTRRLHVGHDDRTELVDSVRWQTRLVEALVDGAVNGDRAVHVHGLLCFVGATWGITNGFLVHGVGVTSPDRLAELVGSPGPIPPARIAAIHAHLKSSLSPA